MLKNILLGAIGLLASLNTPPTHCIISGTSNKWKLLATKECPGCNLQGADLRGTNLKNANLEGANLEGAAFSPIYKHGQFEGWWATDLENANLRNANLKGANFYEANLKNADFAGANLSGASFSTTTNYWDAKNLGKGAHVTQNAAARTAYRRGYPTQLE